MNLRHESLNFFQKNMKASMIIVSSIWDVSSSLIACLVSMVNPIILHGWVIVQTWLLVNTNSLWVHHLHHSLQLNATIRLL